uniref:Reeler domain containing 1 n=1 Tax=Pseudonaja textilis TaxID=8673 RepID=A0A670YUU3_PSETE
MKAWSFLVLWAFTIVYLVSYTDAFSHGASLSACSDMKPKHIRAHLQNPQNNYITIHTNTSFSPGDKVPVTIRSSRDFMGFMLQARRVLNDQIAGTFIYIPPGSKLLTCFEDGDTVTHSDKSLKRNLSFVWKAPDQPIGDIRFFLSLVQSYFVYWAKIESSTVSQQIQNKTITENNDVSSTIKPALLQELIDLKGTFTVGKSKLSSHTHFFLQIANKEPITQKVPLNFLPLAEFPTSGQETYNQEEVPRNTLLKVTRIKPQATVSGVEKEKSHKESRLVAAQLGVLLGCSAVLGMVLAVGLRCIHSQYCHKRTEVSFSEPDNNVIALQDSGEMMHFRKIRENSFVLVQAEYNWISPSSSVTKAVV